MVDIKDFLEVKEDNFNEEALKVFNFQYANNKVYKEYVDALEVKPGEVHSLGQIPFLPVRLFKTKKIITYKASTLCNISEPEKIFTSSSTTGMTPSKHYVMDLEMYRKSFISSFEYFYGKLEGAAVLALLPSYLERDGSSLIYMIDEFIKSSKNPDSGYYLYNHEDLYQKLIKLKREGRKTILFGVTFALLDFAENFSLDESSLSNKGDDNPANDWELLIFETGGMKGRRKEVSREELHDTLKKAFGAKNIHSEYGMCELLSQAYSKGQGIFNTPPWMKIILRDINDPFYLKSWNEKQKDNIKGVINVIDLANLYSCAFIATDDKGTILSDGSFTIDGRLSNAERRGCNMLIE